MKQTPNISSVLGHSFRHVTCLYIDCRIVAGPGIEPGSQGYEPCEIPLLYPAI